MLFPDLPTQEENQPVILTSCRQEWDRFLLVPLDTRPLWGICWDLGITSASLPTKLCISFCFNNGLMTMRQREFLLILSGLGNLRRVFDLQPCWENVRTKLQAGVLLGWWLQWLVLWILSFQHEATPPHGSTAGVTRNFKEFHVRIHKWDVIKIPSYCLQPWSDLFSGIRQQWVVLHELCVHLATSNAEIDARMKWTPFLLFSISSYYSFLEKIIFGVLAMMWNFFSVALCSFSTRNWIARRCLELVSEENK